MSGSRSARQASHLFFLLPPSYAVLEMPGPVEDEGLANYV